MKNNPDENDTQTKIMFKGELTGSKLYFSNFNEDKLEPVTEPVIVDGNDFIVLRLENNK